jgi:AcrR family transcriptional regulator
VSDEAMLDEMNPPVASETRRLLRNEPVQARSAARLAALLDAAAAVLVEVGRERLTTALVAARAGASIGTVYRYFPDRIILLQALAARNLQRLEERLEEVIATADGTAPEALDTVADVFVSMFRTEPGFRSLRLGDGMDVRDADRPEAAKTRLARAIADNMALAFEESDPASLSAELDIALEVLDALTARAFLMDAEGDEEYLAAARRAYRSLVHERVLTA